MGTVVDLPHKQLNMKVMGFVVSLWHAASSPSLELPLPSLTQSALHSLPLVDLSLPPEPRPPPSRPPLSSPARPSSSRGSSSTSCSPSRPKKGTEESNIKMSKSYHRL